MDVDRIMHNRYTICGISVISVHLIAEMERALERMPSGGSAESPPACAESIVGLSFLVPLSFSAPPLRRVALRPTVPARRGRSSACAAAQQ